MADVPIRHLDDDVIARGRERTRCHRRSLEAGSRDIITRSVKPLDIEAFESVAAAMRAETRGHPQSDGTDLVCGDRGR